VIGESKALHGVLRGEGGAKWEKFLQYLRGGGGGGGFLKVAATIMVARHRSEILTINPF